jgi:hypothetical protein
MISRNLVLCLSLSSLIATMTGFPSFCMAGEDTDHSPADKPHFAMPVVPQPGSDDGIAKPPAGIDPGIHAQVPTEGAGTMPIIRPPGTPGGNPDVLPK